MCQVRLNILNDKRKKVPPKMRVLQMPSSAPAVTQFAYKLTSLAIYQQQSRRRSLSILGGDLISVVVSNNRNSRSPPEFCYLYEINCMLCDVRNAIKITFGILGSYGSIRIKGRMTAQETSFWNWNRRKLQLQNLFY